MSTALWFVPAAIVVVGAVILIVLGAAIAGASHALVGSLDECCRLLAGETASLRRERDDLRRHAVAVRRGVRDRRR